MEGSHAADLELAMLVILGGLPGAGKTTIARALARELGAVHVRIDSLEQAIRDAGVVQGDIADVGYRAGYAVAADNLALARTVIADSVNPLAITRAAWRAVAARANVAAHEFEIVCTDAAVHRQRVEGRVADIPGHVLPTWQEVRARRYEPWPDARVIDTAGGDVAKCVRDVRRALAGDAEPDRR